MAKCKCICIIIIIIIIIIVVVVVLCRVVQKVILQVFDITTSSIDQNTFTGILGNTLLQSDD